MMLDAKRIILRIILYIAFNRLLKLKKGMKKTNWAIGLGV